MYIQLNNWLKIETDKAMRNGKMDKVYQEVGIKDENGVLSTEVEDMKSRCKEYICSTTI